MEYWSLSSKYSQKGTFQFLDIFWGSNPNQLIGLMFFPISRYHFLREKAFSIYFRPCLMGIGGEYKLQILTSRLALLKKLLHPKSHASRIFTFFSSDFLQLNLPNYKWINLNIFLGFLILLPRRFCKSCPFAWRYRQFCFELEWAFNLTFF